MQKLKNRFITRSQILRLAPLLLCTTAGATPVLLNEASTTNTWTLPTGPNLISGATATPPPTFPNHGNNDITASTWDPITDGSLGDNTDISVADAPANNATVTFPLDISGNFNGYTLTQFDTYCAWPNSGRIDQSYIVEYSTVSDPKTFLPLTTVSNVGSTNNANVSTHTQVTDSTGTLATNVHSIRLTFPNQQNSYVGYREFILQGTPLPVPAALSWSGTTNGNWTTATADNNWKTTLAPITSAPYNSGSNLTFSAAVTNRSITVPSSLTAGAIYFGNGPTAPYTFTGPGTVSVTRNLVAGNSGSVTFNAPLTAAAGITANGTGILSFGGALQTDSLTLQTATVNLTGASPSVGTLSGTDGTLTLGNTSPVANTVLSVGNPNNAEYDGTIQNASGTAKGSLTKVGTGLLTLNGINLYTGVTTVSAGQLEFGSPGSLYAGTTTSWNSTNLIAAPGGALVLRAGGPGEFQDSDFLLVNTGGLQSGSFLGIDTFSDDFTLTSLISGQQGLLKTGPFSLNLTAAGNYAGPTKILAGAINAGNTSGVSIPGNVILGDGSAENYLNFSADNQFVSSAVITQSNGAPNSKIQLRGTSQAVEGLESGTANLVSIIQNDEAGTPGFTAITATPATLTIHTTTNHSYAGLIRNGGDGSGPLSIIKTGPGTQEFINIAAQSYGYTGGLFINEGTVKTNFSGTSTGFGSPVHIAAGATYALDGTFVWGSGIDGAGRVVKQGAGTVTINSGGNLYSGGTTVESGKLTLGLVPGSEPGEGMTANEHGIAGVKSATNPIVVNSGAILGLEAIAPLGNSGMLPQFGYYITVNAGGTLAAGTTVAFVTNLTLNGATVDIGNGADYGTFNTAVGLVGTTTIGGTAMSTISTSGTGPYANISLGDNGLIGTTFQVADVTGNANDDLLVSTILRDVAGGHVCPLTKTGPGTMHLTAANTYTGDTIVSAGTLILDQPYLADTSNVTIGSAATLSLTHGQPDTVATLTIGGTQMAAGTYVAANVTTAGTIPTARITGTGSLVVTNGPGNTGGGYDAWSAQITDTTQRDRAADPDKDGYTNIQEYLFGTSPIASNGALVTSTSTPGNLVVHWNQLSTPGTSTYVVQESTDLITWTTSSAVVSDDPVQNTANYTLKQATIPVSGARKFVRVVGNE